jgi:hypothetical protein
MIGNRVIVYFLGTNRICKRELLNSHEISISSSLGMGRRIEKENSSKTTRVFTIYSRDHDEGDRAEVTSI